MSSSVLSSARRWTPTSGSVDWKSAISIGLFVGAIFLFATAGNPWGFSGLIVPTVMGRELFNSTAPHFSFGFMAVHLLLAAIFSSIMAPVIHRVKIGPAIPIAVAFGLLFYGVNYLLFHALFPIHSQSPEVGVLVTNVAFAILVAAAYRGKVRGTNDAIAAAKTD